VIANAVAPCRSHAFPYLTPTLMKLLTGLITLALAGTAAALAIEATAVPYVLGPRQFRRGDYITITEVRSTSPRFVDGDVVVVRGR
jgi:hypothetical protein